MILDISSSITVTLGESATTQCGCDAAFADQTVISGAVSKLAPGESTCFTNSTTPVTMVGSPASDVFRQVISISIYNTDDVNHTVTVRKNDGTNNIVLGYAFLVPGASLQWNKGSGWSVFSEVGGSFVINQYTTSGTWTKNSRLTYALINVIGGGGGGGSGCRGAVATNRFGGGGGGGSAMVWGLYAAASLGSTVSYTVGAGGTAGAVVLVDTTAGNAGGNGGDSSFGGFLVAQGGRGGTGGTTAAGGVAGVGGAVASCVPSFGPYALPGTSGSIGVTSAASSAISAGLSGTAACPGGAGGRGITNANANGTAAVTGGGVYNNGVIISGSTVGLAGTSNAALSILFSNSLVSLKGVGTGAGGGDVAAAGGAGGNYGAGAGGGGVSLNGTASGAGGVGGGGLITVAEFY